MKKKSGFTLIELLAVIVILAVIAIITTPIILGVIDKAKRGALQNSAYGMIEAGYLYYTTMISSSLGDITKDRYDFQVIDGKFINSNGDNLSFKGEMPKSGTLQINSNGKVAISICNDNWCACKSISENKVTVKDGNCSIDEDGNITDNDKVTLDKVHPIGSIYITVNNANPSDLFGGSWVEWGNGKVPVGVDVNQTEFNSVEKIGGEKTHTLTVDQMPSHRHGQSQFFWAAGSNTGGTLVGNLTGSEQSAPAGGSQPHNNLQPYITAYMWKRTS